LDLFRKDFGKLSINSSYRANVDADAEEDALG
jgi:hypothetical protein